MSPVLVRGTATVEEVAALVAALALRGKPRRDTGYERWRRVRLAALRQR
jgi:hypothetical protein